ARAIKAAKEERDRLLSDTRIQDTALGFLNADERAVAINALKQGEMRPEDLIRSHMIGAGTGEEEIKEALKNLSANELKDVKRAYARKYGEDLHYALLDELGGQDAVEAQRLVKTQPVDARQAFNDARDEYYKSRDGIGTKWADGAWDGTGYVSD